MKYVSIKKLCTLTLIALVGMNLHASRPSADANPGLPAWLAMADRAPQQPASAAASSSGAQKINLQERMAQLEQKTSPLSAGVDQFFQSKNQLTMPDFLKSIPDLMKSVTKFDAEIQEINIILSSIELRVGLTFEALKKQYIQNFKRVPRADITKVYEYLGLDGARACTYMADDIQKASKQQIDSMEKAKASEQQDDNNEKSWQVRQSQVIFGYPYINDIAKEEYDAFLALNAQSAQTPVNLGASIDIPDANSLETIRTVRSKLDEPREKLATIKAKIVAVQQDQQEFEFVEAQTIDALETKVNDAVLNATTLTWQFDLNQAYTRSDLHQINELIAHLSILNEYVTNFRTDESQKIEKMKKEIGKILKTLAQQKEEREPLNAQQAASIDKQLKKGLQNVYQRGLRFIEWAQKYVSDRIARD